MQGEDNEVISLKYRKPEKHLSTQNSVSSTIFFFNEREIKTLSGKQKQKIHCQDIYTRRKVKGSPSGQRTMISNRNLSLNKDMEKRR